MSIGKLLIQCELRQTFARISVVAIPIPESRIPSPESRSRVQGPGFTRARLADSCFERRS
jgi:hypothetical protein